VSSWVLIWMMLLAGVVLFWQSARTAAEAALRSARKVCEQNNVQLLDQSVAFSRFELRAGVIRRVFSFDYSPNGRERFRGLLWLRGRRTETVAFDASAGGVLISPGETSE
jgi:Protein of unknown function (DUF3301)